MSKRLEMLEKVIAAGSREPFHHYARALELRSHARSPEALAAFERLVIDFPAYLPTYLMFAQLSLEVGDVARARQQAEAGVAVARAAGDAHAVSELLDLLART